MTQWRFRSLAMAIINNGVTLTCFAIFWPICAIFHSVFLTRSTVSPNIAHSIAKLCYLLSARHGHGLNPLSIKTIGADFFVYKLKDTTVSTVDCIHLQVSWIRHRDTHLLTAGMFRYTPDTRY